MLDPSNSDLFGQNQMSRRQAFGVPNDVPSGGNPMPIPQGGPRWRGGGGIGAPPEVGDFGPGEGNPMPIPNPPPRILGGPGAPPMGGTGFGRWQGQDGPGPIGSPTGGGFGGGLGVGPQFGYTPPPPRILGGPNAPPMGGGVGPQWNPMDHPTGGPNLQSPILGGPNAPPMGGFRGGMGMGPQPDGPPPEDGWGQPRPMPRRQWGGWEKPGGNEVGNFGPGEGQGMPRPMGRGRHPGLFQPQPQQQPSNGLHPALQAYLNTF